MGTAKSAVGGGLILATGLMGLGGVANAHTQDHEPAPTPDQQSSSPAPAPAPHQVDANTPQSKGLVGVNAPVALDLHDGVANNLSVDNVARDVAVVGDVKPAAPAPQEQHSADAKHAKSHADGASHTGASVDGNRTAPQVQAQPDAQPEAKSTTAGSEQSHGATGGVANAALSAAQPVAQPATTLTAGLVSHVDQTVQSVTAGGVQLNAAH